MKIFLFITSSLHLSHFTTYKNKKFLIHLDFHTIFQLLIPSGDHIHFPSVNL